jgi:MinD-like ATPase involved in chromosome partitioning or flagellar assembly
VDPADFLPESADPPAMGWRRAAWRAGARWLGPGRHEVQHHEWTWLIRQPLSAPAVIAVVSPKGGVGTSTTAILLGEVLARLRGHLVAAVDAKTGPGDLITRVPGPHAILGAADLYKNVERLRRYTDLAPYLSHSASGLCVVRSSPNTDPALGPAEYRSLLDLLGKFYCVVVVDLGTGIREPAFLAVMEAANAVVPVTEPSLDATEAVIEGLDWLSRRFPGLIRTATAVINQTQRTRHGQHPDRAADALEDWVAQVVRTPADRALAAGRVPSWPKLATATRHAFLELAAAVISDLPGPPGSGAVTSDGASSEI